MDLSPGHARALAASGYLFLFPLVAQYWVLYREAIDPSSTMFGGGTGSWMHHRRAISHESNVSVLHHTTLDSSVWLDLRRKPWSVTFPTAGEACSSRVTDLWGHVVDDSTGLGADSRPVLIADQRWRGEVPPGIGSIVRAQTSFVRGEVRVETPDPGDLAEVRKIQRAYRVEPIGEGFDHPAVPMPPVHGWWPANDLTLTTMDFWPVATFALGLVFPSHTDRRILTQLAELGIAPGGQWDTDRLGATVLEAIEEGMDDAISELMRASERSHHQPTARSRADSDRDYLGRAITTLAGMASRSWSDNGAR